MKKFKVDKHIIELCKQSPLGRIYTIYYSYDNNYLCTTFFYDLDDKKFFGSYSINCISKRQLKLIENKILKIEKR